MSLRKPLNISEIWDHL